MATWGCSKQCASFSGKGKQLCNLSAEPCHWKRLYCFGVLLCNWFWKTVFKSQHWVWVWWLRLHGRESFAWLVSWCTWMSTIDLKNVTLRLVGCHFGLTDVYIVPKVEHSGEVKRPTGFAHGFPCVSEMEHLCSGARGNGGGQWHLWFLFFICLSWTYCYPPLKFVLITIYNYNCCQPCFCLLNGDGGGTTWPSPAQPTNWIGIRWQHCPSEALNCLGVVEVLV